MTEPDDGLEGALRRAMSAAAEEAVPGTEGLSRIRARIGSRPPRPWLLSVLAGWAERAGWSWHGHWAWPFPLRRPAAFPAPRARLAPRPGLAGARTTGARLRLGAVLAGIAAIAMVSLGVQPFRHAIIEASSTVFDGGSGTQEGGGGTGIKGTQTLGSSVANYTTTQAPGLDTASVVPGAAQSAATKSTQAERCVSPSGTPTAPTLTAPTPTAGDSAALLHTPTSMPSLKPAGSAASGSGSPSGSDTVKGTCPMPRATAPTADRPTIRPTPSVSSASSSPLDSATGTPGTPTTGTPTTGTPTTGTPTTGTPTTGTPTETATAPGPSSTYTTYTWAAPTLPPFWYRPTHAPRPRSGRARR